MRNIETILYEYPDMGEKIKKMNFELNNLLQQKNDLYNAMLKANAPKETVTQITETNSIDKIVEKIVDKLDMNIKELAKQINNYMDEQNFIIKKLNLLTNQECEIINLRYFQGLQWGVVARKVHYERSQCFNIHKKAMKKLKEP
jgi:DNA-directed RNA polymerase specialized sigma subunit